MSDKSSLLVAADMLVSGVLTELPPFTLPVGVLVVLVAVVLSSPALDFSLAACLAAFSARRFCFEADALVA